MKLTSAREDHLMREYGLTLADFDQMMRDQDGRCKICGTSIKGKGKAHVDHNHKTGKVRKLLCTLCNTGLGMFQDEVALLARAIVYLQDHEDL